MSLDDNFTPNVATAETAPASAPVSKHRPVAWWLHTVVLIAVLLGVSFLGARAQGLHRGRSSQTAQYLFTIGFEWLMVGYVYVGIRRRGLRMRDLVGGDWRMRELFEGKWDSLLQILLDIAIAAAFWVGSLVVLGVLAYSLGLGGAGAVGEVKEKFGKLIPQNGLQLLLFVLLSMTAGFCEEVIFRGYLQRQFAALGRSEVIGILLQAVIFGLGHGYQGPPRMFMLAVYGAMFGILASLRKSLRPGMIAHGWQDAFSGVMMYVLFVVLKK